MSDANTNATDPQSTNPSTNPPIMSNTQPGTHAVNGGLRNGDGEAQNTNTTDSEPENINGQAGSSNAFRDMAPQRRRVPVTLAISTSPGMTATVRRELGIDGLAIGNDMPQNAPLEPTRDAILESLGVPQTNDHYLPLTLPSGPSEADNFESFGISQPADFSHVGVSASGLSCPVENLTPLRATTALSSGLPVGGNDDGTPDESTRLVDFSHLLEEWSPTPDEEHGNEHTHYGHQRPNTPIDPANSSSPNGRTDGPDQITQAPENPITSVDDEVNNHNRELQNGTQSNDSGLPSVCMSAYMTFTTDPVVLRLHHALSGSSSSGQAPNGNDNRNLE